MILIDLDKLKTAMVVPLEEFDNILLEVFEISNLALYRFSRFNGIFSPLTIVFVNSKSLAYLLINVVDES